jgi:phospho-N-acetylmuramoyl-pentapeptide-transferase
MLYFLGQLGDALTAFNVFRYITFRTAGAVVTALFFVFLFGPGMIALLRLKQAKASRSAKTGLPATC